MSNSTSIVDEVSRIAGLAIGPPAVSAAVMAMTGNREARRAIVAETGVVRPSGVRAEVSVDSMRLGLRSVAKSARVVIAASNVVVGKFGCGPEISTRGGLLPAEGLIASVVVFVAGGTTSSINGTALGAVGDFTGSRASGAFEVVELTDDPETIGTVRWGGNRVRATRSLDAFGCPIGVGSVRGRVSDWAGNGDSVAVITIKPDNASGSARLLGATPRLVAPRRASVTDRGASIPAAVANAGATDASTETRELGTRNDA